MLQAFVPGDTYLVLCLVFRGQGFGLHVHVWRYVFTDSYLRNLVLRESWRR